MSTQQSSSSSPQPPPPKAIIFDLLTALLDSWTLWNRSASSPSAGLSWRLRYLQLTYACGAYIPYETLVIQSAQETNLPPNAAADLLKNWSELKPWPEVPGVLRELRGKRVKVAVVTNCSRELGWNAAALLCADGDGDGEGKWEWDAVVTAEEVGFYKPRLECYEAVLRELGVQAHEAVFVAGSAADVPGAKTAGMRVLWHNRVGLVSVEEDDKGAEREEKDLRVLLDGIV